MKDIVWNKILLEEFLSIATLTEIEEKVFEKDGELYTTIEGIEKAFNVMIESSEDKKNINIYTMDYLIQYFATKLKIEAAKIVCPVYNKISENR